MYVRAKNRKSFDILKQEFGCLVCSEENMILHAPIQKMSITQVKLMLEHRSVQ